jgi:hypothetical protein
MATHLISIGSIEEIAKLRWENQTYWEDWAEDLEEKQNLSGGKTNALNLVKGFHEDMTNFLQLSRVRYEGLVGAHLTILCLPLRILVRGGRNSDFNRVINSVDHWNARVASSSFELDTREVSTMEAYFDGLPELVAWVRERHLPAYLLTDEEIEDAWLSMMFRAFCWHRSHVMIEGVAPFPSDFWNSKMPVYIG